MRRIQKAKLFVFLRYHRHELLDEAFRASNWRVCTKPVSEVSHPLLQHNWHWQPLYKPTRVSQMMRSLKRLSWIADGSWCWIVWIPTKLPSAKERWWPSASG